MDYKDYMRIKSEIEKEYRYYCCESAFRNDPHYEPMCAKYRALHKQICEWETKTLERGLRGLDASFFTEI